MKKLVLPLIAAVSVAACGQPNEGTVTRAQTEIVEVDGREATILATETVPVSYDMAGFLEHFGEMAGNPAGFAEEIMREHGLRVERPYSRRNDQMVLSEVIWQARHTVEVHILGERPASITWPSRFDFEGYRMARDSFDTAARGILSNPVMVRFIGDRVADHVQTAGVSQELFLMLRTARPALETEFHLLPGVNDAWWHEYRRQDEEFQALPGTISMRGICGDDLPRDCVDAWYFLIRRYNDGGIENAAAWQHVGLSVLDALEDRPEFRGL